MRENWQAIAYVVIGLVVANVLWYTDDDRDVLMRTTMCALCGVVWPLLVGVAVIAGLIYAITLPARLIRKARP